MRSTISAEGNSVVEEQEQGEYLRQVLAEWYSSPHTPLRKIEDDSALRRPLVVVSDSNSLVDAVLSDKGRVQDKRLRIVIAMINEAVQPGRNVSLKCENTFRVLADGLTKVLTPPAALLAMMASMRYTPPVGRQGRLASIAAKAVNCVILATQCVLGSISQNGPLDTVNRRCQGYH